MNKRIFLITAGTVAVAVLVLFFAAMSLDESPHELLFDKFYRPIILLLAGPVSWLTIRLFGRDVGEHSLLFLAIIPIASGILWGLILERLVYFLKRAKA